MSCKKMDLGDDSYLYLYGATHPVENGSLSLKKNIDCSRSLKHK